MFSGNAGNISYMLDNIEILYRLGFSIFIYDYRTYGNSSGKLTEQAMYSDAELGWFYLTETRDIARENIVVYGRSLGAAVASSVAERFQPAGLIMESAFTSMHAMARAIYPWLPTKNLLRWHYDNLDRISRVNTPVLFIHSPDDELVPYSHSKQLYGATRSPKVLLTISGGHIHGFSESGDTYIDGIRSFVDSFVNK